MRVYKDISTSELSVELEGKEEVGVESVKEVRGMDCKSVDISMSRLDILSLYYTQKSL